MFFNGYPHGRRRQSVNGRIAFGTALPMWAAPGLLALVSAGCSSPNDYRLEADRVAYGIIQKAQRAALGRTEPFTIETPADTLRRRLLLGQKLPSAAPASSIRSRWWR